MKDEEVPKEERRHVEIHDSPTSFSLKLRHRDHETEFGFSASHRTFDDELHRLTSWVPILRENLSHEEQEAAEENVTRIDGTTNPTYTALHHDRIIYADATAHEIVLTLNRAIDSRHILIIKTDVSANHVVIQAFTSDIGSDSIEGDASISLGAQFNKVKLIGDSDLHVWYKELI